MIGNPLSDKLDSFDYCIAGAGPAGITLAIELSKKNRKVCLIESGGFDFSQKTQSLYEGESKFFKKYDDKNYLSASRLRFFGGTSNHWKGVCRPLDPWDFGQRNWIENSGWPVRYDELWPYYAKAAKWVEIDSFADLAQEKKSVPSFFSEIKDLEYFDTNLLQISPPTRFGTKYRKAITESKDITLLLETNLKEIILNAEGKNVSHLKIEHQGKQLEVKAQQYILCLGAIENARVLLASNKQETTGIGNKHGNVGAYFMEHLFFPSGYLYFSEKKKPQQELTFSLGHKVQKEKKLLQIRFHLQGSQALPAEAVYFNPKILPSEALHYQQLWSMIEVAPVKENRVSIDKRTSKVRLDFSISRKEISTLEMATKYLAMELGVKNIGRVQYDPNNLEAQFKNIPLGSHHMGTTRMAKSAVDGVVDAHGKVFGISNLHCAGSSVFPTGGCQNPTLTILALTLRLAEHLA